MTAAERANVRGHPTADGPAEDDGIAWLSFSWRNRRRASSGRRHRDGREGSVMEKCAQGLEELRVFCDIGEGSISVDETEDIDWINNWKQYYQFYIDVSFMSPSWEEEVEKRIRTSWSFILIWYGLRDEGCMRQHSFASGS